MFECLLPVISLASFGTLPLCFAASDTGFLSSLSLRRCFCSPQHLHLLLLSYKRPGGLCCACFHLAHTAAVRGKSRRCALPLSIRCCHSCLERLRMEEDSRHMFVVVLVLVQLPPDLLVASHTFAFSCTNPRRPTSTHLHYRPLHGAQPRLGCPAIKGTSQVADGHLLAGV